MKISILRTCGPIRKRERVLYERLADSDEEADFVAGRINQLLAEGYKLSDIAILYRTNAQSRTFEEAFLRKACL